MADRIHECPMTDDCPGYDRDRGVCLLRPDDCEFAPARGGGAARPGAAPIAALPAAPAAASGPCNCLPEPPADWQVCAVCGIAQAPGKPSCGFCGHRWGPAGG